MGVFGQTSLLLWKNVLLRIRYPGVFALEVLWPIMIIGIVSIMRTSVPPYKKTDCHYMPRALPSAGSIPFLQSFVCNLDNRCYKTETLQQNAQISSQRFASLSEDLGPYFGKPEVLDILSLSNKSVDVITTMKKVVGDKDLLNGLGRTMNISYYLRDPEKVKDILVRDLNLFPWDVADALLESKINVAQVLDLTGIPDLRSVACDPNQLALYLKFPAASNVTAISDALCSANDSRIADLANQIIRQLDPAAIIDALQQFEKVKENLGDTNALSIVFNDIADMLEIAMSSESILRLLGDFVGIPNIADVVRRIPSWIESMQDLSSALNLIADILSSVEPLMISLGLENSTAWRAANNAALMGINFIKLGSENWNGTAQDFISPLDELIKNIQDLLQDKGGREAFLILDFFTKIDWPSVYKQIITTRTLDKGTTEQILKALQTILEQMPNWPVIQKTVRIVQHGLDMMSIFVEKSIDLRQAMKTLFKEGSEFQLELNHIFQYGPQITKALLETLLNTNVLADIIGNSKTYLAVCERVMLNIKPKLTPEIYSDVHDTLCAGNILEAMTVVVDQIHLTEIWDMMNKTVLEIEHLYEGNFYGHQVEMKMLYDHYDRFVIAIDNYLYGDVTWTEIFKKVSQDRFDFNEAGWEPVTDMLNEDFLTTGMLALYQGLGQVLDDSEVSNELAPYVHVMSQLSRMMYQALNDFTELYASSGPAVRLMGMVTGYMPELVRGVAYMWDENMDSLYSLAASSDPLETFCNNNYLSQMNMPAFVPVNEMLTLICDTDWAATVGDMAKPLTDVMNMIEEVAKLFILPQNSTLLPQNSTLDLEMDWIEMVDYTERIMDIVNGGEVEMIGFTQQYKTFFDNTNFTKVGEGMEALFEILGDITTEDLEKLADLSIKVLENIDRNFGADGTWQDIKWYLAWYDASVTLQINMTQDFLEATNVQDWLNSYPPELKTVTTLLAKAYPQFVNALKNILLDPTKLLDYFLKEELEFHAPDCENHYFVDYTLLPPNSSVHLLERFICDLNMSAFVNNLMENQPASEAFSDKVTDLLEHGGASVIIDWPRLIAKTDTFIGQLSNMSVHEDWDLYLRPFNLTAIDMTWNEFYEAAESLGNFKMEKFLELSLQVQELAMKVISDTAGSDFSLPLYANLFVTHHFLKMANTEMEYFNVSTEIILFDYIWSNELKKVTDLFSRSPEINSVGVATLQRLLTHPERAMITTDFESLCSNVSLFSKVFVVGASSLSPSVLQKLVCELNLNTTLLLEQVQNNKPSVKEFINALTLLSESYTVDDIRVNTSILVKDYENYSNLLEDLIVNPPVIKLSADDDEWMDLDTYGQEWEKLARALTDLGEDLKNSSKLLHWESSVANLLLTVIEEIPGTEEALGYISAILDLMQKNVDHTIANYNDLQQYPNTNRTIELLKWAPEAIQTVLYTVMTQPEKTARWGTALQSWSVFCGTPSNNIMSVPPELKFSVAKYLQMACSIELEELVRELTAYQDTTDLERVIVNGTAPEVNSNSVHRKFDKLFKSMFNFVTSSPSMDDTVIDRLFNQTLWTEVGNRISGWSYLHQYDLSSPDKIVELIAEISETVFGQMSKDITEIFDKTIAISDMVLEQLLNILDSNNLSDAFNNLPSLQILADLLNELPELLEVALYTNLHSPQKISDTVMQTTSFESFCEDAGQMFVSAPNSAFDYKSWMAKMCSINISRLVDEMANYSLTKEIDKIIQGPYLGNATLLSVIYKTENIIDKLRYGIKTNDHVFDSAVWTRTLDRLNLWFEPWISSPMENMVINWGSLVARTLVTVLDKIPGTRDALYYIDGILDVMQDQLANTNVGFEDLRNHANSKIMVDLMQSAPEAIQTLLFTVMTEPVKAAKWGEALQSWTQFCTTPVSDIMSVPSELNFNMSSFVEKACQLDIEALAEELAQFQGTGRLEMIFMGTTAYEVNHTVIIKKFERFLESLVDSVENPVDISNTVFARLFNISLWSEVGQRIELWADKSHDIYSSPDKIAEMVAEITNVIFGGMSQEITNIYDKTIVVIDIILDQIIAILNSNSLNEAFHDLPSLQIIADLLNELPELYETVLYSSIYFPEKIAKGASHLTSQENFCSNNPQDMFSIAPNSSFNLEAWLMRLCSINITMMIEELQDYNRTKDIDKVISGPYSDPISVLSIIKKTEQILSKLNEGSDLNDRIFNTNIWDIVMDRVDTWIWPYDNFVEFLKVEQKRILKSFIAYVENTPGTKDWIRYVDAILNIIGDRVTEARVHLPEAFKDFPTLENILELVVAAPEMVETAIYTVLTQPEKTSAWSDALQSFSAFCSVNVSDIMATPPSSDFDVKAYITKICHVDIDNLISEMSSYDGFKRLNDIATGSDTTVINMTAVFEKADHLFTSLEYYYDHPLSFLALDLRLFNATVWEEIGKRVHVWSNISTYNSLNMHTITQMIELAFQPLISSNPDIQDIYEKTVAVASTLVDEIYMVIEASSIEDAVNSIPSLQTLIRLANQAPELLETLVYTSVVSPQKATLKAQSFMSFEAFCDTDADKIFTVPPGSVFDVRSWFDELCSLNFTEVENELAKYKAVQDITSIVNGPPGVQPDLTTVMDKLNAIIMYTEQNGIDKDDRVLDESVWTKVINRIGVWIGDYSVNNSVLMSVNLADFMLPKLMDNETQQYVAKSVNTVNLFMDTVIEKLQNMKDGVIGLSSLFNNADGLVKLIETYIRAGQNIAQAWLDGEFSGTKMSTLFRNSSRLKDLCSQPGLLALELSNHTQPSQTVQDMSTVICSVIDESALQEAQQYIDIESIMKQVTNIWTSSQVTANYNAFSNNVDLITSIIQELAQKSLTLSSDLTEITESSSLLDVLERIATDPKLIFRLLKFLGLFIEGPLHEDQIAVQVLSNMNSLVVMPVVNILDALGDKGLSLETIANSPEMLLDVLSVLADFDVQYEVIETVLIKSQLNFLITNQEILCNNSGYETVMMNQGLDQLNLPVSWQDLWAVMCGEPNAKMMLLKMKETGLTRVQIMAVVDKMLPVGLVSDLSDMYDHNFGWIDLMSNLEKLAGLVTQGDLSQSEIRSMKSAWQSVKDIVFDKGLKSLLSYLNLLESSAGVDEGWIRFKQYLRFFSSALHFIDKNLDKFAQGTGVKLGDILPDSDNVASLIRDVFGTSGAAEILVTSIDPLLFYRITLHDAWDEICQNNSSLSLYFHFPSGTDVHAVQQSLCTAVTTRSLAFEELLSLFDAGDMLKQLDLLIQGQYDGSDHNESVWETMHSAVMHFIHTAESLQQARLDTSSVEGWFTHILDFISTLWGREDYRLISMCESVVHYLNNTDGFIENRETLSQIITAMNLVSDITKLLPELDDLACIFTSKPGYDVMGVIDKLSELGFLNDLAIAVDNFMNPPVVLNCSVPFHTSQVLLDRINATILNNALDIQKWSRCLSGVEDGFEDMLDSFSKTLKFIKDIVGALQRPELQKLLQGSSGMQVLDFIIDAASAIQRVNIHVADLLENRTNASSFLLETLGLPQPAAEAFLNASVNMDWVYIFTEPAKMIRDVLCNPSRLSDVIGLPSSSFVNVSEISRALCTSEIDNTVSFLQDISVSSNSISEMLSASQVNILDIVLKIVSDTADVIMEFTDLIQLAADLVTGFDIDLLQDNVDLIDDIIQGNSLSDFAERLHQVINDIASIIPATSETQMVIRDVKRILGGIFSLDILRTSLIKEVQVKDLVKDPKYMTFYLTTRLDFDDDIAQEIMDAVFSVRLFFEQQDLPVYTCDEVLKMIIIMNSTKATIKDVSDAICGLSTAQLKRLAELLTPELDVGTMISKYVTYMGNSLLESTNLTATELDEMVEKIDRGLVNLREASDIINQSPNGTSLLNILGGGSTSAFTGADQLIPHICGDDIVDIFSIDFSPGIVLTTTDDIATEYDGDHVDEELDFENEFCYDLYKSVRKSGIGNILWSYLKPIMRGKIIYTPDNEVTRSILKKANKIFELLDEVKRVSTIWAEQTPSLMAMADAADEAEDLRTALQNDFIQGLLEATTGINPQELISGLDALQANNFDRSQLSALQTAAEVVSNYTSCIVTDRYMPIESESQLEKAAFKLSQNKTFFAGIVFLNAGEDDSSANISNRRKRQTVDTVKIPKHIGYKIRMDVDNVMDTNRLKSPLWKMSAEDNFVEDLRYLRGFVFVQDMIDNAIIELQKNERLSTPGSRITQMPFPCHHLDNFIFLLGAYLIPVMMTFTFMASLGVATHNLVIDRENGQEENLHVMGMVKGLNFLSWLTSTMLLMMMVCLILAIMLKYTDIFIYSNLFIIFLLLVDFCFSSVMLLYLVSAFFDRTTMAILFVLMVYLISYMPYILVIGLEVTVKAWHKNIACLASTTAFCFGTLKLAYFEESGIGVQWNNISEANEEDLSVSWLCFMMLIDSAIYFLIGWYVRQVRPGKYGISQPWYFPVKPSFWFSCFTADSYPEVSSVSTSTASRNLFEAPPNGYRVGVAIQNLCKTYGKKTDVVKNLTVNIYNNQITTLLGHNGAAKTTTLKMLCGVLEPTSGQVMINGRESRCCKESLGVCPQQNALFYYMTVNEHMKFYAGMKGASDKVKTLAEIRELLEDVDLWHVKDTPVKDLSYGMKRRLCVALAFVGDSKTIILDEPTSGVDPHARKHIWNLITRNRPGRTILLSTHHLDEADILSDRIAIMHQGKLLCCGSPAFLKRAMGGGYQLTVVKRTSVEFQDAGNQKHGSLGSARTNASILNYIQSLCPETTFVEQVGTDLTFNIPKDPATMRIPFHQFFRQLDQFSDQLGIDSYGLSDTTLEEVFLKLTQDADEAGIINPVMTSKDKADTLAFKEQENARPRVEDKALFSPASRIHYGPRGTNMLDPLQDEQSVSSLDLSRRRKGPALFCSQMRALFVKRFHHYRRNWRILVSAFVLPLIGFLIAMGFSTVRVDEADMKALVLDPSIYGPETFSFFKNSAKNSMQSFSFVDTLTDSEVGIGTTCMRDWANDYFDSRTSCVKGSDWYNVSRPFYMFVCREARQVFMEMPVTLTIREKLVASNEYVHDLENKNIPSHLLRTFRDHKEDRYGGWSFESPDGDTMGVVHPYVWFNSKGYHALPSYMNAMNNIILRSQLPNGEKQQEYGITTLNHPIRLGRAALNMKNVQGDAADAGIALMVVVAFSFIPGGFILYLINERVQKERQLQNISGIHFITYWLVALIWDLMIYSIIVGLAVCIVVIFQTDSYYIRDNLQAFVVIMLLYGWAIIPCLYCVVRFFNKGSTAYLVTFCANLFLAMATVISLLVLQLFRDSKNVMEAYDVLKYLYLIFPEYALGQGLMDLVANTVKYKLFARFEEDRYENPFSTDVIGWNLIALACQGIFFFILTLILDGVNLPAISLPNKKCSPKHAVTDDDVLKERERILHNSNTDMLVISDMSKVYRRSLRKFLAVNHITFGVREGESFGLLGVNGAGKTTTFRMLTGDSRPSGGKASLKGQVMSPNNRNFGQEVGYCPQEGGLDDYLTAEEVLQFHSRLRGFDSNQTKEIVTELLTRLGLTQYANKAVHTYSGGTKRKLALAVAMVGDPPILYLDEPTTGMDIGTRRLAWSCISQANRKGQSVVLTSHSMDECDALCSRIAIMVNGQIKCIGSPQHLKHKFGDGYTAIIHANPDGLKEIIHSFLHKFPGTLIKAKHHNSVEVNIPHGAVQVADILTSLQIAQDKKVIEYYSVSQTTLDSVFISFAQEQTDSIEDGSSTPPSSSKSGSMSSHPSSASGDVPKKPNSFDAFINPLVSDQSAMPNEGGERYARNITMGAVQNADMARL